MPRRGAPRRQARLRQPPRDLLLMSQSSSMQYDQPRIQETVLAERVEDDEARNWTNDEGTYPLEPMDLDEEGDLPGATEHPDAIMQALRGASLNEVAPLQELVDQIDALEVSRDLPLDIDFQEIYNASQFNELFYQRAMDHPSLEDEEPLFGDLQEPIHTTETLLADDSEEDLEDESQSVPFSRSDRPLSRVRLALGLWLREAKISRPLQRSLLEIMKMPELQEEIHSINFPLDGVQLKKEAADHLPLLRMRKRSIPLNLEQQSVDKPSEDLFFFDPKHLFKSILCSSLAETMYFGMGRFVDNPEELWHSHSWMSSIRTTSGEFAHYPDQKPIFPSDFVEFKCGQISCNCDCVPHVGRVVRIGKDYRAGALRRGQTTIVTQQVIRRTEVTALGIHLGPEHEPLLPEEALLSWNRMFHLPVENVVRREAQVMLDYKYGDTNLDQSQGDYAAESSMSMLIRRVIDDGSGAVSIFPLCQTHPPRGELEIAAFGRAHLEQFDSALTGRRTSSLPLLTFIDGFGLYRNVYRSLMGMYVIPAALPFSQRNQRSNVFPLTLGPHGSNFNDVVESMRRLKSMDKGSVVEMSTVSGIEEVLVCGFTLTYLGDMPQQNENSGIKSQCAKYGCRCCRVSEVDRGDMAYDVVANGRYHHQLVHLRQELDAQPSTAARSRFATEHGLSLGQSSLVTISPALDLVLSRPTDPAHSEYQGISKLTHNLLLTEILSASGARSYATALRTFPYPAGCAAPQGPLTHFRSYTLAEHGRWAYVAPILLRTWLRLEHLQPHLRNVLSLTQSHSPASLDPVSTIVDVAASLARSNSMLMGPISLENRAHFHEFVIGFRQKLQSLTRNAANACSANPARTRSRQNTVSRASTPMSDATHTPSMLNANRAPVRHERVTELTRDLRRPNVHIGLHHELALDEYSRPVNVNTLIGENKHRLFKSLIYGTNHHNACRDLLCAENIRQTVRLGIAGAFEVEEPEVTAMLRDLRETIPTLFYSILPRGEGATSIQQDELLEYEEGSDEILSDPQHRHTSVQGKIKANRARDLYRLPVRSSQLSSNWFRALSAAYSRDYGLSNIVSFPSSVFQWFQKFTFEDGHKMSRTTFRRSQFISIEYAQSHGFRVMRIDHILMHKIHDVIRLFIVGTGADADSAGVDPVLGQGFPRVRVIYDSNAEPLIVGLPAVASDRLFIVPVVETVAEIAMTPAVLSLTEPSLTHREYLWNKQDICFG